MPPLHEGLRRGSPKCDSGHTHAGASPWGRRAGRAEPAPSGVSTTGRRAQFQSHLGTWGAQLCDGQSVATQKYAKAFPPP